LEDWLLLGLQLGHKLPVIDGINLNRKASTRELAYAKAHQAWRVDPPDARRLFLNWGAEVTHGDTMTLLHRVVFYGDYLKPMQDLGDLMGFKVIEEGGMA
jgi:hypothetical protein